MKYVLISLASIVVLIASIRLIYRYILPKKSEPEVDYGKTFAMQKQAKKMVENIRKELVNVSFIQKDKTIATRQIKIIYPLNVVAPYPLVYVPHYEIGENSEELRLYIENGWAVASVNDFKNEYNHVLVDDDLVFNNAALYELRHRAEIDNQRIAIIGGSAGGYMSLMLNALQLGHTVSVISSPITNVYFNFYQYFPMYDKINGNAWMKMIATGLFHWIVLGDSKEKAITKGIFAIPVPFMGMVNKSFTPVNEIIEKDDITRWETVSPVSLAECFTSPFVLTHLTSDILVPVDQVTRKYTYTNEGETMPKGISTRLNTNNPGVLGKSFDERLEQSLLSIEKIDMSDLLKEPSVIRYDKAKLYNITIYDEGPTQSYGSHDLGIHFPEIDTIPYVAEMFEKTLKDTEILLPGKILLLMNRYQGKSMQLPAHLGVDDTVYGSFAIYQKEIEDELRIWSSNHSKEELIEAVESAMESVNLEEEKLQLQKTWEVILNKI